MTNTDTGALLEMPLPELIALADRVREGHAGSRLDLCNIMNAKCGMCSEDCKFCAQSGHHSAEISTHALKEKKEIVAAARNAHAIGAERFGIVTSGNTLAKDEIARIADSISNIKKEMDIKVCASLGGMEEEDLKLLRSAGLERYHHNIETSRAYYPKIVTTHSFDDRVAMIKRVKKTGLEICSGGIIGMGESWQDRIEMASILKELDVDSVPINMLVPIKGTPLENMDGISCPDAIRTIAIFRVILGGKTIKVAAGRESVLKDFQGAAFMAGANGMLIGGYLTIKGRDPEDDRNLIREIKKTWNI